MTSDEQPCDVQISFQDGCSEGLLVTRLGPNSYRLEESSALGEASYHDVIEAERQPDGTLLFLRILTPSGLKTVSWILSLDYIESPDLTPLLDKVMAVGGNWERMFGGVLLLHLPPSEHDRISDDFNEFFQAAAGGQPLSTARRITARLSESRSSRSRRYHASTWSASRCRCTACVPPDRSPR